MQKIEVISRALIIKEDKILVCRDKKNKNYFFPGGHIEVGEFSREALKRELMEELSLKTKNFYFIGLVENRYTARKKEYHEINFIYYTTYYNFKKKSVENHLDFFLFSIDEFKKADIRPKKLKEAILTWKKDKKFFHIETID